MAQLTFPVFIVEIEDDKLPTDICIAWSKSDPRSLLESTDVEDSEFAAWDSSGCPVRVFVRDDEVQVELMVSVPQRERLRLIIVQYANNVRPECQFSDEDPSSSVVELWDSAKKHMQAMGFWRKFFRRF